MGASTHGAKAAGEGEGLGEGAEPVVGIGTAYVEERYGRKIRAEVEVELDVLLGIGLELGLGLKLELGVDDR